jgi:hypothetical protein
MECGRSQLALLHLDVGRPDHLAPLLGIVGDEFAEVGGRARERLAPQVGKPRLHLGIGEARVDLRVELVANASTLGVLCWKSSRENIVSTANFLGR